MEDHPIPQDVTGFQFKLIGNMTVKQFAYLITGIVLAWVIFQLPVYFIIKFPISAILAVLGISLAYLPVQGRPLDIMISHFIKALITPTQFVYQKSGGHLYFPAAAPVQKKKEDVSDTQGNRLNVYLQSLPHAPRGKLDEKETNFLASLSNIAASNKSAPVFEPKNEPMPDVLQHVSAQNKKDISDKLEEKEAIIRKTLETAKIQEQSLRNQFAEASSAHEKVSSLESKLEEVNAQKQELAQQLLALKQKMNMEGKSVFTPSIAMPKIETKNVKSIPFSMGKNTGLPTAPTAPNIITGIVKDPRGNALPNILVEVRDKENNPVRAFKTNGLGRFLSATPLLNGVYTIEFEDPKGQNKFDTIEITVNNNIIMPLEVISIDTREILRKSLFGS